MKKKNKIILTVFIILVLLLLVYLLIILRNISIINELIQKGSDLSQKEIFSYQTSLSEKNNTNNQSNISTYTKKNSISKISITNQLGNDVFISFIWKDTSTNEGVICSINTTNDVPNQKIESLPASETTGVDSIPSILTISYPIQNKQNKMILAMTSFISTETIENQDCFKLYIPSEDKTDYFNCQNGNLVTEVDHSNGSTTKFTNLTLSVTNDQVTKPDLANSSNKN